VLAASPRASDEKLSCLPLCWRWSHLAAGLTGNSAMLR